MNEELIRQADRETERICSICSEGKQGVNKDELYKAVFPLILAEKMQARDWFV